MARYSSEPLPGPTVPNVEPRKSLTKEAAGPFVWYGGGTGKGGPLPESGLALWQARQRAWRDGFDQIIATKARTYWWLYRAFDQDPPPGAGAEWRDRTVVPEAFKIIETRLPRIINAMFGDRNWSAVEGVERSDEQWEETVRVLLETELAKIGSDNADPDSLILRAIEGHRYREIMGHVWWRCWWRHNMALVRTKVPIINPETGERKSWREVEFYEELYDGVDAQWIPLDSLAINLKGGREWAIEKVETTIENLVEENDKFKEVHGRDLYKNLGLLERSLSQSGSDNTKESFEEPRDTEHWPLQAEHDTSGATLGQTRVTLWLCWDNKRRTLTKIVNGNVAIDEGLAPTPNGLDPYFGNKAVPVPYRVYGDSILNWVGPLVQSQTRLRRARMDEVMLNIWQQFLVRSGVIRSDQFFWSPGGHLELDWDSDRPLSDVFQRIERKPVFQEAWTEEAYSQRQAEETAAADPVQQGVEPTTKSRDVTAAEIRQRVIQGASRQSLEALYHEVSFKRPLLKKTYALLRQNLTKERIIRVLGQPTPIDLTTLDQNIDLKIGGGLHELSTDDRRKELEGWINLAQTEPFGPFINAPEVLKDWARVNGRKDPERYVRSQQQIQQEQVQQAALAAMAKGQASMGGSPPPAGLLGAGGGATQIAGSGNPGPASEQPEQAAPAEPSETVEVL